MFSLVINYTSLTTSEVIYEMPDGTGSVAGLRVKKDSNNRLVVCGYGQSYLKRVCGFY